MHWALVYLFSFTVAREEISCAYFYTKAAVDPRAEDAWRRRLYLRGGVFFHFLCAYQEHGVVAGLLDNQNWNNSVRRAEMCGCTVCVRHPRVEGLGKCSSPAALLTPWDLHVHTVSMLLYSRSSVCKKLYWGRQEACTVTIAMPYLKYRFEFVQKTEDCLQYNIKKLKVANLNSIKVQDHRGKVFFNQWERCWLRRRRRCCCLIPVPSSTVSVMGNMLRRYEEPSRNISQQQCPFRVNGSRKCVTGRDRFEMRDPNKSSSQYPPGEPQ